MVCLGLDEWGLLSRLQNQGESSDPDLSDRRAVNPPHPAHPSVLVDDV